MSRINHHRLRWAVHAILLILALLVMGLTIWQLLHNNSSKPEAAGVLCDTNDYSATIVVFYKPGTNTTTLSQLAKSVGAHVSDGYQAASGASLTVNRNQVREAVQKLKVHPELTRVDVVPNDRCDDPD